MPDPKKYEKQFFDALRDIFIGAQVEGDSGYINLMRIKSRYYEQGVFPQLQKDINAALKPFPDFREELFDKLYTFFQRYFSESGSIYFRYTALHQNVYEKVYTDDRDVMLFWKTHMLYYVKTDRIFTSLNVELEGVKFFFDASKMELKKANEKRETVYTFRKAEADGTLVFDVAYSEKGKTTKVDDILKAVKQAGQELTDETLAKALRVFEKQSEVDYFINKNARAFLQEQFELWMYQYLFAGQNVWSAERLAQLQALKAIAFKVIDFISQFEDELVKIWNKPKFVRNSHYVVTLDRIANPPRPPLERGESNPPRPPLERGESNPPRPPLERGESNPPQFPLGMGEPGFSPLVQGGVGGDSGFAVLERLLVHPNIDAQVQEWRDLGMVDDDFEPEDILFTPGSDEPYTPDMFAPKVIRDGGLIRSPYHLPYNPKLVERARELRKNMTPAERKLWNGYLRQFRYPVLRQRPIDQYIVDFYCAHLKLVIEIDGDSHYTEAGKANDAQRSKILEGYGLRVVRFTNTQVLQEFDAVCKVIEESPLPPLERGVNAEEADTATTSPLERGVDAEEADTATTSPLERGVNAAGEGYHGVADERSAYYTFTPPLQRGAGGDSLHPQYQYLPLDTKYFPDLELDILALFDDLDTALDGWLVHSENYQALNTLLPKFRARVRTIYIDPPYNTNSDGFIYRDKYPQASWLTMMENRLGRSISFLHQNGVCLVSIDDYEFADLRQLSDSIMGKESFVCNFVWRRRISSSLARQLVSTDHEYVLTLSTHRGAVEILGEERDMSKFDQIDQLGKTYASMPLSVGMTRKQRPNQWFELINPNTGTSYWPPEGRVWCFYPPTMQRKIEEGKVLWPEDFPNRNMNVPRLKLYPEDIKKDRKPTSTWINEKSDTAQVIDKNILVSGRNEEGTRSLKDLLGEVADQIYPKPVSLIQSLCEQFAFEDDLIFDFFAGSGTTAHAVMNLNRADGGKRKYILVEMGEHFNTVILPRIKKVAFCSKWKDGKPNPPLPPLRKGGKASALPLEMGAGRDSAAPPLERGAGGDSGGMSHFVKYYALEQYEDVLRRARYQDADLFDNPYEDPYHRYVFLRDVKNLDALEIEADKNKVHFHPERLYPKNPPLPPLEQGGETATPPLKRGAGGDSDIDLAETLSHLRGKWIRHITADFVEFQDGERISLSDPDWRLLKPLIWWQ